MKNRKVIMIIIIALIATSISMITVGTYAYFTSRKTIVNTFVVGNIDITLTEPTWEGEFNNKNLMPGKTISFDPTIKATKGNSFTRIVLEILDESGSKIEDHERLQKIREILCYDSGNNIQVDKSYTFKQLHDGLGSGYCPFIGATTDGAEQNNNYISFNFNDVSSGGAFGIDRARSTYDKIVFNACYQQGDTSCTTSTGFNDGNGAILTENGSMKLFTHVVVPSDWSESDIEKLGNFKLKLTGEAIQSDAFSDSQTAYEALDAAID